VSSSKKDSDAAGSLVQDDGLRYKRKASGSPFNSGTMGGMHSASMSCFKCGAHRPRNELKSKRLLGKNQMVCAEGCKPR
jgi:hypothetical protein